jgi:hypothetical protein
MDKDKLLNKIQVEKQPLDERELSIKKSSYHWGYAGGAVVLLSIMIIRFIAGELFSQDLLMILMGQLTVISFYEYIQNKENRVQLYFSIFSFLVFLGTTYNTMVFYEIFG